MDTLPEVLADLMGRLGDRARRGLPESNIIAQLGGSLREIRDTWGVTKEAIAGIVPESWLEWGLGAEGDLASRPPEADMLAAHDAVTTNHPRKAQQKFWKLVKPGTICFPHSLAGTAARDSTPAETGDPLGGSETETFGRVPHRSLQGAGGAAACLRVRPTHSLRVLPAAELVGMGRRFIGIEGHVAMRYPCCAAADVDIRDVRICPRAGAQVNQHQPRLHAIFPTSKRLGILHQVESGEPLTVDRKSHPTVRVTRFGFNVAVRLSPLREELRVSMIISLV